MAILLDSLLKYICMNFSIIGTTKSHAIKICLFCVFLFANQVYAARWANVVVDKAIVYSDVQMSSEVGYISKGKKIRVGDVAKNKGRILAVVINKRVAYIKIADLSISNDIKTLQSITERITQKMNKKTERRKISIYSTVFTVTHVRDKDFEQVDAEDVAYYGFGLTGYYTRLKDNSTLKISFENLRRKVGDIETNFYGINIGSRFHQIDNSFYTFDFYYGGIIHPFIEYNNNDETILNGQGIGGFLGTELIGNISRSLSFHVEAQLDFFKMFNFGTDTNSNAANNLGESFDLYFLGPKILGKIAYSY